MLAGNNLQGVRGSDIIAVKGNTPDKNVTVADSDETTEGLPKGRSLSLKLTFKDKPKDPIQLKLTVPTVGGRTVVFSPMMTFSE